MEKDDIVVSDYKRSPAKHKKRKFKHKRQQENQQYSSVFQVQERQLFPLTLSESSSATMNTAGLQTAYSTSRADAMRSA